MFTGIVQCAGEVLSRTGSSREGRFVVRPSVPFAAPEVGESIAVNGACLTAESFSEGAFTAYASGETLSLTTLAALSSGNKVNLERALLPATRLGGHLVSGHVDCVATVDAVEKRGQSTLFRLAFPRSLGHLVVAKGSVALDGVSLTINGCGFDFLEVNIIPETLASTVLHQWRRGSRVNMETDLIGKYVARMLAAGYCTPGAEGAAAKNATTTGLTMDFLRGNGFEGSADA
jgi:riboflavin synthase